MKKTKFVFAAMALLAVIGVPNLAAQVRPVPSIQALDIPEIDSAVPTLSTEARYSAWLFTSDVDDYIDVNSYNPDIGTFFFMGGFPAVEGNHVADTDIVTNPSIYALSVGFAHTFSNFYLGLYLGGNLVDASGWDDNGDYNVKKASFATAYWDTKLAVLFGTENIGAIRLDLIIDAEDTTTTYDGKNIGLNNNPGNRNNTSGQGVTTSVTWGSTFGEKENIYPHATLGFRFPDYNLETDSVGGSKTEAWEGSIWGLNGGLYWDLNDISTLDASVSLVGTFGSSTTGENKQTVAGGFGGGFEVGLINIIEPVDGLSLAAKPKLGAGVYGIDANESGDFTYNAVSQTDFALSFAVDLGIKARLPKKLNKFTLITGASLDVVNWEISGESGGAGNLKGYDRWSVTGFSWNGDNLAAGNSLGLGLVFAPNDHLTVGAGLNTLLDHFFKLDLVRMRLESGDFFSNGAPFYTGAGGAPLQFDLTVSYKL